MTRQPLLIAHRGDHRRAPENTMAAFAAAVATGCDGTELDVRRSRDGIAVVLHDASLRRVQGVDVQVSEASAAELAAFAVPALHDVLASLPPAFVVDIEIKERAAVEPALAALTATRGRASAGVIVSSFDLESLEAIGTFAPWSDRWVISERTDAIEAAERLGCSGVAIDHDALDDVAIRTAHDRGLKVMAWTVVDPEIRDRLALHGVDAIGVEGDALDR